MYSGSLWLLICFALLGFVFCAHEIFWRNKNVLFDSKLSVTLWKKFLYHMTRFTFSFVIIEIFEFCFSFVLQITIMQRNWRYVYFQPLICSPHLWTNSRRKLFLGHTSLHTQALFAVLFDSEWEEDQESSSSLDSQKLYIQDIHRKATCK